MNKPTILVIDDKVENIELAKKQLGQLCTLRVVSTFRGAKILLERFKFDAVLTDCFMPGEGDGCSSSQDVGSETPYGLVIAILAKNLGINRVAIVTNYNHHASPIKWALDAISQNGPHVLLVPEKNWSKAFNRLFTKKI